MTVLNQNPCFNEVCYKGLHCIFLIPIVIYLMSGYFRNLTRFNR